MDHRNLGRSARPQVPQRSAAPEPVASEQPQHRTWTPSVTEAPRRKKWPAFVAIVAIAIVAIVLFWFMFGRGGATLTPAGNRYQAVFLDNGQVFFGKLKNTEGTYLVLEKAYYTKKAEVPADATAEQKAAIENNVSLAKVGGEVYGPESTMSIRAEQVLFWQNLTADSKVAKAIQNADDN